MLLEEYINVINAIRSYVNGEEMDQAFCSNLAGAYQICKKHNLTAQKFWIERMLTRGVRYIKDGRWKRIRLFTRMF